MKRKYPKAKFTKHAHDKHRRMLAEMPERVAQRQQNIYNRNQMLASTQAYNLSLDKQRVQNHIRDFASPLSESNGTVPHWGL